MRGAKISLTEFANSTFPDSTLTRANKGSARRFWRVRAVKLVPLQQSRSEEDRLRRYKASTMVGKGYQSDKMKMGKKVAL